MKKKLIMPVIALLLILVTASACGTAQESGSEPITVSTPVEVLPVNGDLEEIRELYSGLDRTRLPTGGNPLDAEMVQTVAEVPQLYYAEDGAERAKELAWLVKQYEPIYWPDEFLQFDATAENIPLYALMAMSIAHTPEIAVSGYSEEGGLFVLDEYPNHLYAYLYSDAQINGHDMVFYYIDDVMVALGRLFGPDAAGWCGFDKADDPEQSMAQYFEMFAQFRYYKGEGMLGYVMPRMGGPDNTVPQITAWGEEEEDFWCEAIFTEVTQMEPYLPVGPDAETELTLQNFSAQTGDLPKIRFTFKQVAETDEPYLVKAELVQPPTPPPANTGGSSSQGTPPAQASPPSGGQPGQVWDPVFGWITPSTGAGSSADNDGDPDKQVGDM